MTKRRQFALIFLLAATIGAGVAAIWLSFNETGVPSGWIKLTGFNGSENYEVSSNYEGPMEEYPVKAGDVNTSSPDPCPVVELKGKARFIDPRFIDRRVIGPGENRQQYFDLGYIVDLRVGPQPVTPRPPIQPPAGLTPVYWGVLSFVLKDGEDFVVMSASSGPFAINPGEQERYQGFAEGNIPFAAAKRTRKIAVRVVHAGSEKCDYFSKSPG